MAGLEDGGAHKSAVTVKVIESLLSWLNKSIAKVGSAVPGILYLRPKVDFVDGKTMGQSIYLFSQYRLGMA